MHMDDWAMGCMPMWLVTETVLHIFNCIIDPRKRNFTSDMLWLLNVVPMCSAWCVKPFKLFKVLMLIYSSSCTATDHTRWFPLTCRRSDDQLAANLARRRRMTRSFFLVEWIFTGPQTPTFCPSMWPIRYSGGNWLKGNKCLLIWQFYFTFHI